MKIVWVFGGSENRVISNETYAWREPLSHILSSLSRLVIKCSLLVKKKKKKCCELKSWALSVKGLMILVLKCKWGSLECFKICEERLWNCHYGVITAASHRSDYKDGGGVGVWTEPLSARGLPAELSWSGRVWRDHPEDWGFWREQFRKSTGIRSRSGWRDRWLEQRSMATGQVGKDGNEKTVIQGDRKEPNWIRLRPGSIWEGFILSEAEKG